MEVAAAAAAVAFNLSRVDLNSECCADFARSPILVSVPSPKEDGLFRFKLEVYRPGESIVACCVCE